MLDASAAAVPVLPLRFGAVLASDDAVAERAARRRTTRSSPPPCGELEGRAEYVVKGRYDEDAILRRGAGG